MPATAIGSPAWTAAASCGGAPSSAVTVAAISSARAASASRRAAMRAERSAGGVAAQPGSAARAARTAASTSSAVPAGTWPTTCSSAGLTTEMVSVEEAGRHSPPMYIASCAFIRCLLTLPTGSSPIQTSAVSFPAPGWWSVPRVSVPDRPRRLCGVPVRSRSCRPGPGAVHGGTGQARGGGTGTFRLAAGSAARACRRVRWARAGRRGPPDAAGGGWRSGGRADGAKGGSTERRVGRRIFCAMSQIFWAMSVRWAKTTMFAS